jgi:MerR family mercuric resistance operon transcriptional regulator
MENHYFRGQLAKVSGVKAETIRYYESIQLLSPAARQTNNHRVYKDLHRDRLHFIRRARELGFTLAQVQGLLELVDSQTLSCAEVKQVTESHLHDIQEKIRDLHNMPRYLASSSSNVTTASHLIAPLFKTCLPSASR